MTKKKSTKTTLTPPKRDHLPALNPARLIVTLQQINAMDLPTEAKQAVAASLQEATNPDAEKTEVVIATLDQDEQDAINAAQADYRKTMGRMAARGRAALEAMSDEEWQKAVDAQEAKNGD